MSDPKRVLENIRIASPCTSSWDQMTGNDKVRFCADCKLNVYNISNMTADEATALIEGVEGRLCIRFHQRKDGTVITEDCPVGVRAAMVRVARVAGAVLTAVLGLFSGVAARATSSGIAHADGQQCTTKSQTGDRDNHVKMGMVAPVRRDDVTVAVVGDDGTGISDATVVLTDLNKDEPQVAQMLDGTYHFRNLQPGVYTLTVTADGFEDAKRKTVRVHAGKTVELTVTLKEVGRVLMGDMVAPTNR